jgi:hypothetical protein
MQHRVLAAICGYTGLGANALGGAAKDPNVWSGRASQEVFLDLAVLGADSDEVAQAFRNDAARRDEMMPPGPMLAGG